jgi:hypothetical protein
MPFRRTTLTSAEDRKILQFFYENWNWRTVTTDKFKADVVAATTTSKDSKILDFLAQEWSWDDKMMTNFIKLVDL